MYQKTILPNGLRVLTAPMPHTHSVAISVYVGAGSRYERKEEAGLSHFVEHLCFKGTERRPTAKEVAEAIDGVGGLLNGGTDRELTVFYAKVARPHLDIALDLLVDLVRCPRFDLEEVEKERQVVLEELAMVEDSPPQLVDVLMDATLWPDQPLGWDVAGTPESVTVLTRQQAFDYLHHQYIPNNIVVSVAGNVEHQEIVDWVWKHLGLWAGGVPSRWFPVSNGRGPRWSLRYKTTEQAHISLAVPGLPINHADRYALNFLSVILGEGMSSRLFMELREKKGLVYDVHSYVTHFLDTGAFSVYAGVDPKNAVDAVGLILAELATIRDEGISEEELVKARELSKGRLLLRMEDTRNVSGWIGAQELLLGDVRTVDQVLADVEAVTREDVQRVARQLLRTEYLHLAIVGPYRTDRRFVPLLRL